MVCVLTTITFAPTFAVFMSTRTPYRFQYWFGFFRGRVLICVDLGRLVYNAASVGVVMDLASNTQVRLTPSINSHTDAVTAFPIIYVHSVVLLSGAH